LIIFFLLERRSAKVAARTTITMPTIPHKAKTKPSRGLLFKKPPVELLGVELGLGEADEVTMAVIVSLTPSEVETTTEADEDEVMVEEELVLEELEEEELVLEELEEEDEVAEVVGMTALVISPSPEVKSEPAPATADVKSLPALETALFKPPRRPPPPRPCLCTILTCGPFIIISNGEEWKQG